MAFNVKHALHRLGARRDGLTLLNRSKLERAVRRIESARLRLETGLKADDAAALTRQLRRAQGAMLRAASLGSDEAALSHALAVLALACETALGRPATDLQLMAALAMYQGYAVQMGYAAGKPLALALAAILHVWSGRPCHVVCATDYLARRDAAALAPLYRLCGGSVAAMTQQTPAPEWEHLYGADVLYASGRQLLSDFMRDHLLLGGAVSPLRRHLWAQRITAGGKRPITRATSVALIDDVEGVLVDEAASPVQISAAGNYSVLGEATIAAGKVIDDLKAGRDYQLDWQPLLMVRFTRQGEQALPTLAPGLPVYWQSPKRCADLLALAILARDALQAGRHYVVQEGQVRVIDDKIYPLLAGRGWHFGVLQAIEAREGLSLTIPPRTISRTAYQTFFPRYHYLAGAGTTLNGLDQELWQIYQLRLLKLTARAQTLSGIPFYAFATRAAKLSAFVDLLEHWHRQHLPVLAGAPRVADALALAQLLAERGIAYVVVDGRELAADVQLLTEVAQADRVTLLTGAGGRSLAVERPDGEAAPVNLQALLFEPWESRRADYTFFAQAHTGVRFASLEDELLTKYLPLWAGGLRQLAKITPLRTASIRLMAALAQRQAEKKGAAYRRMLVQREEQLDQQLAFAKKD